MNMTDESTGTESAGDKPFKELEPIGNAPVAPAHGIAAIALNMAMKYHDMNMVHDGVLYQQYKMEGRNLRELHLDIVFETAIKIERHLLTSSERIAAMLIEAIEVVVDDDPPEDAPANQPSGDAP